MQPFRNVLTETNEERFHIGRVDDTVQLIDYNKWVPDFTKGMLKFLFQSVPCVLWENAVTQMLCAASSRTTVNQRQSAYFSNKHFYTYLRKLTPVFVLRTPIPYCMFSNSAHAKQLMIVAGTQEQQPRLHACRWSDRICVWEDLLPALLFCLFSLFKSFQHI